jgi:predicted pyridoxine 5'-phosphate oxidase superfamily flavin-nucleotide-binding protein
MGGQLNRNRGSINFGIYNKSIEINIVDIFIRKGYRFKGSAEILSSGSLFDDIVTFYKNSETNYVIKHIVMVKVDRILAINSPVYDTGISEVDVVKRWIDYWASFYPH